MKSSFFTRTKEHDTELTEFSTDYRKCFQYSTQQWREYRSTVTPPTRRVEKCSWCLRKHEQKASLTVYSSWGDTVIHVQTHTSEGNRKKPENLKLEPARMRCP